MQGHDLQHAILHTLLLSPLRRLAILQASHICKWMLSRGLLKQRFKASFFCRPALSLYVHALTGGATALEGSSRGDAAPASPGPSSSTGQPWQQAASCCLPSCQLLPGCKQLATQQAGISARQSNHCCSHAVPEISTCARGPAAPPITLCTRSV